MKKLLNGAMVFALLCSASMMNVNAKHKNISVEVEKTLQLQDGNLSAKENFTFTMLPKEVEENTFINHLPVKSGLDLGDKNTISIAYNTSDTDLTKKMSFDLSDLVFDKEAAIYRYEIKENIGNTLSMTYDQILYIVDVYVTNEGYIEYIVSKDQNALVKKAIEFTNTYETETLVISKEVDGIFADKQKDFTFRLTLDETSTLPNETILKGTKTLSDGTFENIDIVVGAENVFTLKHNENLTISNIPEGLTYSINEDVAEGYTSEKTDSDNGVMSDDGASVNFVNTKIEIVDTGIMLNYMPYILSVSTVGAAFLLLTVLKRKKTEM